MAQITGGSAMVDKLLGSAYRVVKEVRDNLDAIRYLAANMDSISTVATNFIPSKLMTGKTSLVGQTVDISLDSSIAQDSIVAQAIMVISASGVIYGAESGYFTAWVSGGELFLKVSSTAPIAIQNSTIHWMVFYNPSSS